MSLNEKGEAFHDYLIVSLDDRRVIMDFDYTSHQKIQELADLNAFLSSERGNFTTHQLLTGNQSNWDLFNEEKVLDLLEGIPSQGDVQMVSMFVPAHANLGGFGTPVFDSNDKLIGHRVQREVPVEQDYNGILLNPADIVKDQDQENMLIFTTDRLMPLKDYDHQKDGQTLIVGNGKERHRASKMVLDWSKHFDVPFLYDNEACSAGDGSSYMPDEYLRVLQTLALSNEKRTPSA
ncbi:hypothetical protein HOH87_07690 [bacterium]|mgnify:CR=1 FL=1|jgi:hypothetical protein|nr:hypothetical protein [bacterium]